MQKEIEKALKDQLGFSKVRCKAIDENGNYEYSAYDAASKCNWDMVVIPDPSSVFTKVIFGRQNQMFVGETSIVI